jgi:5-methylcytosine-specific restriction protein A
MTGTSFKKDGQPFVKIEGEILSDPFKAARLEKLVDFKKKNGAKLFCEVKQCGFDFEARYGSVGAGFAEVHHLRPLSTTGATSTRLSDLAVLCSNCHRMVHRGGENRELDSLIPT